MPSTGVIGGQKNRRGLTLMEGGHILVEGDKQTSK